MSRGRLIAGLVGIGAAAAAMLTGPMVATAAYPTAANGRIVFQASGATSSDILLMNADGSSKVPVTNDAQSDSAPVVSPNGKLIAFARDSDPSPAVSNFDTVPDS